MAKATEYVERDFCDDRHTSTTRYIIALGSFGAVLLTLVVGAIGFTMTALEGAHEATTKTEKLHERVESIKENGDRRESMLKEIRDEQKIIRDDVKQILRNGGHE